MRRPYVKPVLVFIAAVAFVAGLVLLGRAARVWLDRRGHFDIAIADIGCTPPPGMTRLAFLSEVQYLGGLPDRASARDPASVLRVAAAFAGHPWVERVESVSLSAEGGPRAVLHIRTPVLAVDGRAVDRHGVLLPTSADIDGLIVLRGSIPKSKGPAGAPWGDSTVEQAAGLAAMFSPQQDRLRLREATHSADGFVFSGATTLRWGPFDEMDRKHARLLELLGAPDSPLPESIDLTRP